MSIYPISSCLPRKKPNESEASLGEMYTVMSPGTVQVDVNHQKLNRARGCGLFFFNFLFSPLYFFLSFFFLSVFPLDYVEALGNLRDSRGFLVLPFFFLVTNKERIRRHGPEVYLHLGWVR